MKKFISFVLLSIVTIFPKLGAALEPDINTILMKSTFKLVGINGRVGTCFVIGKESAVNGNKAFRHVLITAAHVLDGMPGDSCKIILRKKEKDSYTRIETELKIRDHGFYLYVKHPTADVAAMYVNLPQDPDRIVLHEGLLATDNAIEEYEIHPGKEVLAVGFPYAFEGNAAGFPIIRSGRISSYPILPTKAVQTFIVDFNVFGGNSGGPVYLYDPDWHKRGTGRIVSPVQVHMVMGLVSSQVIINNAAQDRLGLANVVNAAMIKETIDLLK